MVDAKTHRPTAALIGVTGYGRIHFRELTRLHEAGALKLAAATVINPDEAVEACERLAARKVAIYQDFQDMLDAEGSLDLCCIPTGIAWHRPMAEAALARGANVLLEKPLAGRLADARAIVEAGRRADRWVAVGFQATWNPSTRAIKQAITEGRLGTIRRIAVTGIWPRPRAYYQRNAWAGRKRNEIGVINDNPANNALAHFLNLALFFASPEPGQCARVLGAEAELTRANPIETYDTVLAEFHTATEAGTRIFYGVTHAAAQHHHPVITIIGDAGRAIWSLESCRIEPAQGDGQDYPGSDEDGSRALVFDSLARRLQGDDAQFLFTAEQALAHAEAVEAIDAGGTIQDRQDEAEIHGDNPDNPLRVLPGIEEQIFSQAQRFLAG
jgi:predicted dehydrogenase